MPVDFHNENPTFSEREDVVAGGSSKWCFGTDDDINDNDRDSDGEYEGIGTRFVVVCKNTHQTFRKH